MIDIGTISLVVLLGMLILLLLGVPLGMASGMLAVAVLYMKFGDSIFNNFGRGPLNIIVKRVYGLITDFILISIPLFILMANLFERAGIANEMYESLNRWLNRTRGGVALVTLVMAVIMAAMSGIIGGEVVLLGLIALPQMLRLGYNQNLAIGVICAGGSLGTMIPPSIVLIIYGLVTETSIKSLFTAAFLPGFVLATFYAVYIITRTRLFPEEAPLDAPAPNDVNASEKRLLFTSFCLMLLAGATAFLCLSTFLQTELWLGTGNTCSGADPAALEQRFWTMGAMSLASTLLIVWLLGRRRARVAWEMGRGLAAPLAIVGVVLGSIYGGVTGITEAAAMGVVAVLLYGVVRGKLGVTEVVESLVRTISATGAILWVTIGATALAG